MTWIEKIYSSIELFIARYSGHSIFPKVLVSLIIMVGLFFLIHYFWNIISLVPLNILLSYIVYHLTSSKILVIILWIFFIPWCKYLDDLDRREELLFPGKDAIHKLFKKNFSLLPLLLNRYIRWLSMTGLTAVIYYLLFVYCMENTEIKASRKALFIITLTLIILFFILFIVAVISQSVNIFKKSTLFDNDIDYFEANRIAKSNDKMSSDEVINIQYRRGKRRGIISGIIRIIVYIISFIISVTSVVFGNENISGNYSFLPVFFIIYVIWCIYAKSYYEKEFMDS